MAKAYYGSRFSPNMTRTPEGFLVCHNVPIARIGVQEYLGEEIGYPDKNIVKVVRLPYEVFHQATLASFEGKPLTDEHHWVSPDNVNAHLRGVTTNVRQGAGNESDLVLADFIIYDSTLISEIENGKREVSCGYDCVYEPLENGQYAQRQIRGNHVAVVKEGRAGPRVAIKDSKTERRSTMPKVDRNTLLSKILKAFSTTDASPEEIGEAHKLLGGDAEPPTATPSQAPDPMAQILEALKGIDVRLTALEKAEVAEAKPADALDALAAEIGSEESKTVPAETMEDEAGPVSDPSDRPDNPIPGADSKAAILAAINAMKPAIAAISDPTARKQASDALAAKLREQMGKPATPSNAYAAMKKPAKPAQDSKPQTQDDTELGKQWAKQFNPHYKNR